MDKKEKLTQEQNLTQEQKKKAMEEAYKKYLLQMLEKKKELEKAEAEAAESVAAEPVAAEPEIAVRKPEKAAKKSLAVRAIDAYDRRMEKVDEAFIEAYKSLMDEIFISFRKYRAARVSMSRDFLAIVLISCGLFLVFNKCLVYEYAYNGRVLGYVNDQSAVTDVLSVAGDHLSSNNKVDVKFVADENITFKIVSAEGKTIDSSDEAVNKLAYMTDVEITACGIYEDGVLKAVTDSEESAQLAVNTAINKLSVPDEGMEKISAETTKAITFQNIDVMLTSVLSETQTAKALEKGGEQKIYHIVAEGETIASIIKTYGVKAENIFDENNLNQITTIEAGQKVCIHKTIEALEVKLVEKGTMVEVIPFKTIEKESDQVYKGETRVEVEGVDGRQTITGKVTKVGGKIVKRNLTKKEVIIKRVDSIVLIGTADKPKEAPTGTFIIPTTNYTITDVFGPRWGRNHNGIDFGAPTGTDIYASDGGTVVTAEYHWSFGNYVDIDHGNGKITRYAHCSELYVTVGQKVYQGQVIAAVGSTGSSTGPHLHFEMIVNDEYVDPGPILGVY